MNITPEVIWSTLLAGASAFVLLSNAVEKVVKAYKTAKAPNIKQDERIDELYRWRESVDRRLKDGDNSLGQIRRGDKAMQGALIALLDHGIDGNNIEQMREAKKELNKYFIEK